MSELPHTRNAAKMFTHPKEKNALTFLEVYDTIGNVELKKQLP